jgi:hypothetical protein
MKYLNLKKALIILGTLLTIGINMAAILLPLNGVTTKEVSDSFEVYFVPAGYVFSIWSIIYLALIAFSYYQARLKGDEYKIVNKILPWFLLSNLANCIWLFTWHYQFFFTGLLLMLILLASLLVIYVMLIRAKASELPKRADLFLQLPFSIYLGWISVATIANVTNVLHLLDWNGWGISGQMWAALLIIVAGVLAVTMMLRHKDYAYAAVIVWAVTGIAQKFPLENEIVTAVMLSVLAIAGVAAYSLLRRSRSKKQT